MKRRMTAAAILLAFCIWGESLPASASGTEETAIYESRSMFRSSPGMKPLPDEEMPYTPQPGEIEWSYADGVLTVSGTGDMPDYKPQAAPWSDSMGGVREIRIAGDVTYIGESAFAECAYVESVVLSPSVRIIGYGAFAECPNLRSVTFSEGLEVIGKNAFRFSDLMTVELPSTLKTISAEAFCGNYHLTAVSVPEGVANFGDRCFADCFALADLTVPDSAEKIGLDILEGDKAWFQHHQEDFIVFAGHYLYRYQGDNPDVIIPDGITAVDQHCFSVKDFSQQYNYMGYVTILMDKTREDIRSVTIPDSVTALPKQLCYRMPALEEVRLGSGIQTLPENIFGCCGHLKSVSLPDQLISIEKGAFYACSSLSDLDIPDTVQEIGKTALDETPWLAAQGDLVIVGDGLLYCCQGDAKNIRIPEGVKVICSHAVARPNIVSVTLPSTVRKICWESFLSYALVDVTLNEGLEEIPERAFVLNDCFSHLYIPESIGFIPSAAFVYTSPFAVTGKPGSAAEQIARDWGLPFYAQMPEPDGPDMTLDPETDCWSFSNSMSVFGSSLYLSGADQELVQEIGAEPSDEWGGSCFGMSVSVILAKNGVFSAGQIDPQAETLSQLKPDSAVQSMINYYQYTQCGKVFRENTRTERLSVTFYRMMQAAEQVSRGGSPFLLCFETDSSKHAVVGYGTETGSWSYENREWTSRILIYDPNAPGFDGERCLYYDPVTFAFCIPKYSILNDGSDGAQRMYFCMCSDPAILNAYPYPFAQRFCTGDLDGDGQLTAADAAVLVRHLLNQDPLSADGMCRADLSGDCKVNAADLTLLKRMILQKN